MVKLALLSAALVALASSLAVRDVQGHAYLVQPKSRETGAVEDASGSMGCPSGGPGQVTSFAPGETIDVRYWRNNHIGGFIRWAISPRGQESKKDFDQSVFYYTCRESGAECRPNGENEVYSGDNSNDDSISCGDTITLPDWLPAGDYTLQWTWMSVGSSYSHRGWANAQYRSCADITLTAAGTGAQPTCPTFVGGDRVGELKGEGKDVCFYFYTNDIVSEVFKGDDATADQYYMFGVPKQIEECGRGATTATNTTTVTKPASSPAPVPAKSGTPPAGPGPAPAPKAPGTKPSKSGGDDGKPGVVRPAGAGKGDWEFCSSNSECANQCCSKKYSDDGKMKCTPHGC